MTHQFGHGGGFGTQADVINPELNLKRYVDGDIYAGLVLLNDSPTSVDATQYEYSLSVFSNKFDGGLAAPGDDWPIELPNSNGLFQLVGLMGASTTSQKQLGFNRVLLENVGFDSDADGVADGPPSTKYISNATTIGDYSSIQTIPGVNLSYSPTASSVIRKTYNRALPEFVGTDDYVTLTERIPKRPTIYKYGGYFDSEDDDKLKGMKETTFGSGFNNALYIDQEGKIKQVGGGYEFSNQPPLFAMFGLFDKFLFNRNGVQTEAIEFNAIFDPSSDKFVGEPVTWTGDEESAFLGLDHTERITKYLQEPYANVKHLFRLFLNEKFKTKYETGESDWSHLASAVEYYDSNLKLKSVAVAGNEAAILLDEEGKIHVISNANYASATTADAGTMSLASAKSLVNHLFVYYPEKYRKPDWSEYLDSNGVPNDLESFPYMSSEKYFWLDDTGELVDTEDVVFVAVQAVGSTLVGEGVTLFAIDDRGKMYARELKSTTTVERKQVEIPGANQSYNRIIERTKYTSYDANGVPNSPLDPDFMRGGYYENKKAFPYLGFDGIFVSELRPHLERLGYSFPSDPLDPTAEDLPLGDRDVLDLVTRYLENGDPHRVSALYRDHMRPESVAIDWNTGSGVVIHQSNSVMRFLTASLRQIPKSSSGERCPVFQISDTFEHLSVVVYADLDGESLSPLIIDDETEVVPNYKPGIMHLGVFQLRNGNLINSLAKKLSPKLAVQTFESGVDPLDDSLWSYIENTSTNPDKTVSFDALNYDKLFKRTVGGNDHWIPPRNIGGTRVGVVIHSNNDKIAYITGRRWKGSEFDRPELTTAEGELAPGEDISRFVEWHPIYFRRVGLNIVPDYEPWRRPNNPPGAQNLFFNQGNLFNFKLLPNSRANAGFNPLLPTWDSALYPSKTDPEYGDQLGIPMMGSINAVTGRTGVFSQGDCYPGFCNPPLIFPPASVPGETPTPSGPYLPGIPPHESGALFAYYRGKNRRGDAGSGQQYGPMIDALGDDDLAPDWDALDQFMGGNAAERILDPSLFDEDGNPLIDIKKSFSFWANSGRLSTDIPQELRDDPLFLRDFRVPNKINERNFINDSNLECIPYPDEFGQEYNRSPEYVLNSANLTILDTNLADGSGRTIEYATGHADVYYIVLSDGSVRAMTYRLLDSDSFIWYPARGPVDRDVTQPRIGLLGETTDSADREITAFNKANLTLQAIRSGDFKSSTPPEESEPTTPAPIAPVSRPTSPTPPATPPAAPPTPPPAPPTPPMSPPSSGGGYGY